ncbi:MAG: UDP-N-acetylmuramate dehydrogenase [Oscillospiraceae bacterium]|nr:UDP-N-acetylmuramate dehydrogenase [Oscillospiraceae bacterium]
MSSYDIFDNAVKQKFPGMRVAADEPMSKHTSFRIGGAARRMAFPKNECEFALLLDLCREIGMETLILGNGTNLLVADEGIDRVVVATCEMSEVEMAGENVLKAAAGVPLALLAVTAQSSGLTGLEFAHGIPGSVGGAVVMNAGAYGGEIKQVVRRVTAWFPGGVRILEAAELDFSYRHSVFSEHPEAVVMSAEFALARGDRAEIKGKMEDLMNRRRASQPLEYPSAGSTFKRPEGYFAGALIEQSGLKGARVGGAQVSEKHAGFIINTGGATCGDVLELIKMVQERIYAEKGVRIEPEVKIIK